MNNELWANLYLQEHAIINGRNVWHYLVDSSIGQINIIQAEGKDLMIHETITYNNYDKAEKLFKKRCQEMLNGKYL